MDCIFCKIICGDIPSNFIYEDNDFVAFNDINPQAKSHILLVPKIHFENITDLNNNEPKLTNKLIKIAGKFNKDFRLIFNTGKSAGQTVMHIHAHILNGFDDLEKL